MVSIKVRSTKLAVQATGRATIDIDFSSADRLVKRKINKQIGNYNRLSL